MNLTLEQKRKVTAAVNSWIDDTNAERSANKLGERSGVNPAYISHIKKGVFQFENKTDGRISVIKDSHFNRLADAIGLSLDEQLHWEFLENFKRIQRACRRAQKRAIRTVIDGWTRMGKTHALEHYSITNDYVLYVKCTQNMSAKDLLDEILHALNCHDNIRGNHAKLRMIKSMILRKRGYLIIIDEVEVVKPGIYGVLKDISDWANRNAGFIICGMDILTKLERLAQMNKPGFPQLRGRFFGNKIITASTLSETEVIAVCEYEKITNSKVQNLIADECKDLDKLSQWMYEILDWEKDNGRKITESEVIKMFNIKKSHLKAA